MSQVTQYGNWCYIDRLDGEDLQDGERVIVTWPDGVEEEHRVIVTQIHRTAGDMGHETVIPIRRAYVAVRIHGAEALVNLRTAELDVRRIGLRDPLTPDDGPG